jgi:hypothetical protein
LLRTWGLGALEQRPEGVQCCTDPLGSCPSPAGPLPAQSGLTEKLSNQLGSYWVLPRLSPSPSPGPSSSSNCWDWGKARAGRAESPSQNAGASVASYPVAEEWSSRLQCGSLLRAAGAIIGQLLSVPRATAVAVACYLSPVTGPCAHSFRRPCREGGGDAM